MGLEPPFQTKLYEQFWRPMEVGFGQQAYGTHFDSFMRHYLTMKTGEIPNVREVYEAFKVHARSPEAAKAGVEMLMKDLRNFARYFCAMALGAEAEPDLRTAFRDLQELKVDVAYPFLLELYDDYATGVLEKNDFVEAVRLVEAYVFRRAVCAMPANSMNKTFATFTKALKKERYLESIQAHILSLPSYRSFQLTKSFAASFRLVTYIRIVLAGAIGYVAWKTTGGRNACRSMSIRSSTSCRRTKIYRQPGSRILERTGSVSSNFGYIRSET